MIQSTENLKSSNLLSKLFSWLAVIVWAAIIFLFSGQQSLGTNWGIWDFLLRKAAHMSEFAILFVLVWRAVRMHGMVSGTAMALGVVIALAYAVTDELHQSFVPGRTASFKDVAFDLAGIICAVAVVMLVKKHTQGKVEPSE